MTKDNLIPLSVLDELLPTSVGHDVIRYISLPELLGSDSDTLLYFVGRKLARRFDIKTKDDIYYIFKKLSWGQLDLVKERKNSLQFHLMSDEIVKRLSSSMQVDFRLESGFLAEAIQKTTNRSCECFEKVNKKLYRTQFDIIFTDN